MDNPLGGLDQLLHGRDLRAFADPVLLQVRGFDPVTQRYRYAVNPRFGDTRPSATELRAPFRVTLDVSVNLSRPLPQQALDKWLRTARRGNPGAHDGAGTHPALCAEHAGCVSAILAWADSLLLQPDQMRALQEARTAYRAQADSLWAPLVARFATLGDAFDLAEATREQSRVADTVWEFARRDLQRTLPTILTPGQRAALPPTPAELLRARAPLRRTHLFL
jgi:hypothetical protein